MVQRDPNTTHPGSTLPRAESTTEPSLEACLETFWQMGPEIDQIQIKVTSPEIEMEILKILGDLPLDENKAVMERLKEVYHKVSRKALDVAFDEHQQ